MSTQAGLWIDHKKAVIVTVSDRGEETKEVESDVERHGRFSGGRQLDPEPTRERRFEGHLQKYYDAVIHQIHDAEAIYIFGPGEAKGELQARLEHAKLADRVIAVEPADDMTDRQIAAKVRERFSRA